MRYFLASEGNVTGPFTREVLDDSLRNGAISTNAQICEEGTQNWRPVHTLWKNTGMDLSRNQPQQIYIQNNYIQPKSPGIAVLLEVLPSLFFQTFGIGNLYAGSVTTGLVLMFTYWATLIVNGLLTMVFIGFITLPLTWVIYLVIAIITANNAAQRENQRQTAQGGRPY